MYKLTKKSARRLGLIILFQLAIFTSLFSQKGVINRGAKIIISEGAILYISGDSLADYTNLSFNSSLHGRIDLDGKMIIEGDWINSALSGGVFMNVDQTGEVWLTGSYAQIIGGTQGTTFEDLIIDKSETVLLEISTEVYDSLVLSNGLVKLGDYHLILGAQAKLDGSPSATSMVIATSTGQLRKMFSAPGSFTFPVGDDDGTDEYSPVTVDLSGGTYGGSAYVGVSLVDAKHPDNASTTDFISRYWDVSSYNISGYLADVTLNYTNADVNGTESNIYGGRRSGTNWHIMDPASTTTNELTGSVNALGSFTGGELGEFEVSISLDDNDIYEGSESAGIIHVSLTNDDFELTLNPDAWTVSNLPLGVSKGTVTRTGNKTVNIGLDGNRTVDYDSDITDVTVLIDSSQLKYSISGVSASTGVVLIANDDAESISLSDNGIVEGAEDGSVIGVKLSGGTFINSLNDGSWNVNNLPTGVNVDFIQRISSDSVRIVLTGNRTIDYDSDITNVEVEIPGSDIDDYSDPTLSENTGILFDANPDAESITMEDDGLILESNEDGEIISVTLSGGTFVDPINDAFWTLTNMPTGVSQGTVTRTSATTATIQLSGNRTVNYDVDITNTTLTINANQVDDHTGAALSVDSGVVFTAQDEALVVNLYDDGLINEEAEDGEIISVALGDPKIFAGTINSDSIALSNLPVGVTKGTITRVSDDSITIALVGNRTRDYDNNITNLTVRIDSSQIANASSNGFANTGVTFTANVDDPETIAISTTGITEGSEDGAEITASLTNGTFAQSINKDNWSLSDLPNGVSIDTVVKTSDATATITLSGNRNVDFDSDITTVSLTVTASEVDDHPSGDITSDNTVTINAVVDDEVISISDNGIDESAEDLGIITVTLSGGTYVSSLNPDNWTVENLPGGVTKGTVTWINSTEVEIELDGNRRYDYDANITNIKVTVIDDQVDEHSGDALVDSTGVTLVADDDTEVLVMSDDSINEGAEDGEVISIEILGGTFTPSINPANWDLSDLPNGVSILDVIRVTDTTAEMILSGNRLSDYDQNITPVLSILPEEADDTQDTLKALSGVEFIADIDVESIAMFNVGTINEGYEDGEQIQVVLTGGTFADPLDLGGWTLDNVPIGVSIDTVELLDISNAMITLEGNRSVDYDVNITNATLAVDESQIDDLTGFDLTASTGVEFIAVNEMANLAPWNVDTLKENNLDTAWVRVTLINDAFVDGNLNKVYFTLNNEPSGLLIDSVSYFNSTNALVGFEFDGTDFDLDIPNFSLTIEGEELQSMGDITTNDTLIVAVMEAQSATISHAGLTESYLDGADITITLVSETFADDVLSGSNFILQNAPAGVSVANVQHDNSTQATLTLSFDGTDFDTDITDFSILIKGAELSAGYDIATNTLTIVADIEPAYLLIYHDGLSESNLNGATVELQLKDEIFIDETIDMENVIATGIPPGVGVDTLVYVNPTSADLILTYDGTDFDSPYIFQVSVNGNELDQGVLLTSNTITITAIDDIESISMTDDGEIHEQNEDGEMITVTLTGGTFVSSLNKDNWILTNLPGGVTADTVIRMNATTATITLAGNRTVNYDEDITDLTLSINPAEVDDHIGDPLVADSGVVFTAGPIGVNSQESLSIYIYSYLDKIYVQNSHPTEFEARAVVYNLLGQAIIIKELEPITINTISVPWLTNEYIVKLYVGDKIYSQKVFIYVE